MKGLMETAKDTEKIKALQPYKVCVLMSTYNGERFLEQQIESILNQKDAEVLLLVRDDASTDKTVDILKRFRDRYPEQIVIFEEKNNIGWSASFLTLLYKAKEYDYPYYAFSDQDDIWLEDKLSRACERIKKTKIHGGVIHYANQMLIDNKENVLFEVSEYKDWFERNVSKKVVLLDGQVLTIGCVMTFDRALLDKATQGDKELLIRSQVSHDYWVGAVAIYFGKVIYSDEVCILHRRHDGSVTNSGRKRKRRFFTRYRNFAKVLYQVYKDKDLLSEEDRKYLYLVAKRKNLLERIRLIGDREFCYPSKLSTIKLRIQILLGIF